MIHLCVRSFDLYRGFVSTFLFILTNDFLQRETKTRLQGAEELTRKTEKIATLGKTQIEVHCYRDIATESIN